MPTIRVSDGVGLYVEETGSGSPVVFVHEFAGDHRSWEPQLRHFGRRHRAITYAARGYPPSDIPQEVSSYSQARAADDIRDVIGGLGLAKAHVVGLSMGGFATLHFGLRHPGHALSLTVAGCGYGAEPAMRERFQAEAEESARRLREQGMAAFAATYGGGPTRVQFENKDPRGHAEFAAMLAQHSAEGSANTQLGVQRLRPSLYDLETELAALTVPTLVLTGDEDWPCLAPALYLKRTIPSAGLVVVPNTGHTVNLEEPGIFNDVVADFIAQVEAGRWPMRDPRALSTSITGIPGASR